MKKGDIVAEVADGIFVTGEYDGNSLQLYYMKDHRPVIWEDEPFVIIRLDHLESINCFMVEAMDELMRKE